MGTNFYQKSTGIHLGKRSCAGLYCFNCDVSLCKGGTNEVHNSDYDFYNKCPQCGSTPNSCATSFTWAIRPQEVSHSYIFKDVVNEYGEKFRVGQFLDLAYDCPIWFYQLDRRFS